jgi:hypothetical protein
MFILPPAAAQTTEPWTFCAWPSIVTLVLPAPAVAVAEPAALVVAAAEVEAAALVVDAGFFSSLEQPDNPATKTAAPATVTTNPRFTDVSLR